MRAVVPVHQDVGAAKEAPAPRGAGLASAAFTVLAAPLHLDRTNVPADTGAAKALQYLNWGYLAISYRQGAGMLPAHLWEVLHLSGTLLRPAQGNRRLAPQGPILIVSAHWLVLLALRAHIMQGSPRRT
jgi:hypothetical protein